MPELPDVAVFKQYVDATSLHQRIEDVEVADKNVLGEVGRFPERSLLPHREEGATCPRCGGKIAKATTSGRSSYFCERHQTKP